MSYKDFLILTARPPPKSQATWLTIWILISGHFFFCAKYSVFAKYIEKLLHQVILFNSLWESNLANSSYK